MRFDDRRDAGSRLAAAVAARVDPAHEDVLVLGLPRGGVPVAAPVAERLGAPLDVLLVRKVGHPRHREYAIGAVAEGGVEVLRPDAHDLPPDVLEDALQTAREELAERAAAYRDARPGVDPRGRTVVVVDDGLATGATARVALEALRTKGAARLVLAVPVASPRGLRQVADLADDVVCLHTPRAFAAVGGYYRDFTATSTDRVRSLLTR